MTSLVVYNCINSLQNSHKPIIIFATPDEAEAVLNACKENKIKVSAFCDNEARKADTLFCGLKIIHTSSLKKKFPDAKIIIAHHNINDCVRQITEIGYSEIYSSLQLIENYQLNKYKHIIPQSYMEAKISVSKASHSLYFDNNKTFLRSLDIVITTKCSMSCESCANLMQFYSSAQNTDEKIVEALEILENNVDYIGEYRIIGGEPLMNRNWDEITLNIASKKERNIFIYTNGTIAPKEDKLKKIEGKNINFYITDYGKLSKNIANLEESLKRHGIGYQRELAHHWVDCSNIRKHNRNIPRLKQVFKECCAKKLFTLLNGKLFTCPFIANALNLKAIPDNKADYVDLFSDSDSLKNKIKKLVKMDLFFPACDFCDGRPIDPTTALEYAGKGFIKAGIQANETLNYKEYK
jgi:organic radical activating enzyme